MGFSYLPGMWRFSEPEIFFHLTWMIILGSVGTIQIKRVTKIWVYILIVGYWILAIRFSKPYPTHTQFVQSQLSNDWQKRVFQ